MLRNTIKRKTLLSDHMPFLVKSQDVTLIGWNILCKMSFFSEYNYFNNGFACNTEESEEYKNRLSHIATQLNYAVGEDNPAFICMQECPETKEFRDHFVTELKEKKNLNHYQFQYYNNDKNEYYLITLFDAKQFTLIPDLSEKISLLSLTEGLHSRILPLVFSNNTTKETLLVVNVHADFCKEIKNDLKILKDCASELNITHIILLGDFNRDLVLKSDNYSKHDIAESLNENKQFENLYVHAIKDSSFFPKLNAEKKEYETFIETRDGCIADFFVEVKSLTEINAQNKALAYTKTLASRLNMYPDKIFEVLESQNKNVDMTGSTLKQSSTSSI